MPLYEYLCEACGHRFETIRKFSDPPIEVCPKCGGTVNKLQSAPAFHLKGSGWYITDYARKDAPGEKGDTPSAPASENAPAPAKSEVSSQKSEDKSQKAEVKSQKSEGKSDKAEGKSEKSEGKSQKSEGQSQKADGKS
jgi:putative FmdB family regulatory protein